MLFMDERSGDSAQFISKSKSIYQKASTMGMNLKSFGSVSHRDEGCPVS